MDKATGNATWRTFFEEGDQEDSDLPQLTPLFVAVGNGTELPCADGTGAAPPLRDLT
jgi:hypothetical protein